MGAGLDPDLRRMMRQTFTAADPERNRQGGDRVYGTQRTGLARVEPDDSVSDTSASGEERSSQYRIFTEVELKEETRVWVMGANPRIEKAGRVVMSVVTLYDDEGRLSHYEALV